MTTGPKPKSVVLQNSLHPKAHVFMRGERVIAYETLVDAVLADEDASRDLKGLALVCVSLRPEGDYEP